MKDVVQMDRAVRVDLEIQILVENTYKVERGRVGSFAAYDNGVSMTELDDICRRIINAFGLCSKLVRSQGVECECTTAGR